VFLITGGYKTNQNKTIPQNLNAPHPPPEARLLFSRAVRRQPESTNLLYKPDRGTGIAHYFNHPDHQTHHSPQRHLLRPSPLHQPKSTNTPVTPLLGFPSDTAKNSCTGPHAAPQPPNSLQSHIPTPHHQDRQIKNSTPPTFSIQTGTMQPTTLSGNTLFILRKGGLNLLFFKSPSLPLSFPVTPQTTPGTQQLVSPPPVFSIFKFTSSYVREPIRETDTPGRTDQWPTTTAQPFCNAITKFLPPPPTPPLRNNVQQPWPRISLV